MKTLLAIIAAASLVVSCGVIEEEQTTTDSGVGVTTSAPTTPAPVVASWSGTKQLGSSGTDVGKGIATDSSGNIYVTGYTDGGLDGNTNSGSNDLFVVKYDSSGTKQWTQQLGTSYIDTATGITTDSSGNVYVTGYTSGGLDGNTKPAGSYIPDLFVVKYDSGGAKQWTKQLGTSLRDEATGIATDSSGNVYVTGHTYGELDGNTSAGYYDLFVVKYDSGGVKQWTQQPGTSSFDFAEGIATDFSGNVYVTGHTYGSFDGNTNAGLSDFFVVKYDSSGTQQWTQQLGTFDGTFARGIASDSSGNVYVTGGTSHGLFVVKYDSSGTQQWTQQPGTSTLDYANGISTDSSGNVYVTGYTDGDLDGSAHVGQTDIFVAKYNSSGVKQWTRQLGTSSYDSANGISTDSSGNVYVTGYINGSWSDSGWYSYGSDIIVVKYDSGGVQQ